MSNITTTLLNGVTKTLVAGDWFYAFRMNSNDNTNGKIYTFDPTSQTNDTVEIVELVEPCFVETYNDSVMKNYSVDVSNGGQYSGYISGLGMSNLSPGTDGATGAEVVVYSNYTTVNSEAIITDSIGGLLPPQSLIAAKNTPYRFLVSVDTTNQYVDWIIEQHLFQACIHKDMIIDDIKTKISDIVIYPEDPEYISTLNLGKSRRFVKFPVGSLGENIPSAELLLTPEHPILFNGREIVSQKLIGHNGIHLVQLLNTVDIYALAYSRRKSTKIHNVDVMQWSHTDFVTYCANNKLIYDKNIGLIYNRK